MGLVKQFLQGRNHLVLLRPAGKAIGEGQDKVGDNKGKLESKMEDIKPL